MDPQILDPLEVEASLQGGTVLLVDSVLDALLTELFITGNTGNMKNGKEP